MSFERVLFASTASLSTGAGHVRRLIELSKALPERTEKFFYGELGIAWVEELATKIFRKLEYGGTDFGPNDLVILDSYEEQFCLQVQREFPSSRIVQIADRYTYLLPKSQIVFMDLPFTYRDSSIESRVLAHGIDYLPKRCIVRPDMKFRSQARQVLITTGGIVNEVILFQLMEELVKKEYREIRFEFIGGIESFDSANTNFHFNSFGGGFDSVAENCDTAISAAGTTMWDLLANKVLVGLAASVENQRANFHYAVKNEEALAMFYPENIKLNVHALKTLLFDSNTRQSLYKKLSGKYDFDGARRAIDVIIDSN